MFAVGDTVRSKKNKADEWWYLLPLDPCRRRNPIHYRTVGEVREVIESEVLPQVAVLFEGENRTRIIHVDLLEYAYLFAQTSG